MTPIKLINEPLSVHHQMMAANQHSAVRKGGFWTTCWFITPRHV